MSDEDTTPPDNFRDAIDALAESTDAVKGFNARLDKLDKRDRSRKRQLRWTWLSLAADIALSIFLIFNNQALHTAQVQQHATQAQIRSNQVANCQDNNRRLAKEKAGIDAVIDNPAASQAEEAILNKLLPHAQVHELITLGQQETQHNLKLISTAFAPKDCVNAYPLSAGK